ncbi:HTH DNA-binding protein [Methanosarcina sp. WWM596]|nr:HTH DNA-binding protein [Methanosarcina sp. WWM596]AKB23157.1 HTH DNA-binding protein [Methanosarcina sp. WH1]
MSDLEVVSLTVEELEALRLVDIEGLRQEDAATRVGISRRAFWEDLKAARMKVALALSTGKAIEIKGGNYIRAEGTDIKEYTDT